MVFLPDYPIRTERLDLRPLREPDYEAFHALYSDPEVARYLYNEPRDRTATSELMTDRMPLVEIEYEGDRLSLTIELRETRAVIGQCTLLYKSLEHQQGEIGYLLRPKYWRQGFATEVSRELLRLGFDDLGLHRIIGRCDARNTGSAAVLTKIGMRLEAHLVENEFVKGEWVDELVYAILAAEWEKLTR
ncbi:MAG TPA: GNAT family N-acetyltransferase [Pseudonocardiaceae bacterium]